MASWLQNRLRAAEDLLEAVDRTAKTVAVPKRDAIGQLKGPATKPVPPTSDVIPTLCIGNTAVTQNLDA